MSDLDNTQLQPFDASLYLVINVMEALLDNYDFSEASEENRKELAKAVKYLKEHPGDVKERQSELRVEITETWINYYKAENDLTIAKLKYEQELAFAIDDIRKKAKKERAKAGEPMITVGLAEAQAHREIEKVQTAFDAFLAAKLKAGRLESTAKGLEKTYWDKYSQYNTVNQINLREGLQ